jgi:hypothetical protein
MMKKIIQYILSCTCLLLIGACSKDINLTPGLEQFNVVSTSVKYKVGDTIKFNFEGNPDLISFYSGELYHQYDYKEGRKINLENLVFSFSSANPPITPPAAQPMQLSVFASTDFNGNYSSYESVKSATWTDISSQFKYGTSATYVASGAVNFSDLVVAGKPLYIGFKYTTRPIETNGAVRPWYINNIKLVGNSEFGEHLIGDLITSDFRLIEQKPDVVTTLSSLASSRITLLGYELKEANDPDPGTETWAISKGFNPVDLDNGPDVPFIIKGNEDPKVKTFNYMYGAPGNYKVYFVGANINIDNSLKKIIEINITIE